MAEFGLGDYLAAEGRLIVRAENFDFEAFAETALRLVNLLFRSGVGKAVRCRSTHLAN